jgi:NAD(P)-dependent dehydrogenase (short-subunit alcohol dehydrogenase family)
MKSIFITGAAHGIGLATARRFAARGWFVGLYDINGEEIDALLASDEFSDACGQYRQAQADAFPDRALKHCPGL